VPLPAIFRATPVNRIEPTTVIDKSGAFILDARLVFQVHLVENVAARDSQSAKRDKPEILFHAKLPLNEGLKCCLIATLL